MIEEAEALPLLKAAFDRGLNTWDTANVYSNGVSEELIGRAIQKYSIPREKVILLTKLNAYVGDTPGTHTVLYGAHLPTSKDYVNRGGLSRGAIFAQVEASLRRLGTEYIDVLQIHRFDRETPIEETMLALHDLVRAGKVRYLGASSMWAYQFVMMQNVAERNGWTKFVSMQCQYNLLYREEEREMIKFCNETGVGLIPWAPLGRGYLARPAEVNGTTERSSNEGKAPPYQVGKSNADKEVIKRVSEVAEKKGWKMSHVALAWVSKRVSSPIIGFSSIERMDEALEARGKELTKDEEDYLEEPYVAREVVAFH